MDAFDNFAERNTTLEEMDPLKVHPLEVHPLEVHPPVRILDLIF
jgi:hypothetical protein